MDNINSGGSASFGFGTAPKTTDDKQKDSLTLPVEERQLANTASLDIEDDKETLDSEYTDVRSISISLVKNFSLYRKANDKVLPKKKDFIGSSVNSSRTLYSNKDEVEAYFPALIGISPNNVDFIMRVKQYYNNIKVGVDELGVTFNTSFIYNKKSDYYKIKAKEEAIEESFQKANRQDTYKLKEALKVKIEDLNILEGSKHKFGRPVKLEDYLMYRHCLLYGDVAKDLSLINIDSSIRFYFKDDKKEGERLRKFRNEVNKAKANYVACLADDTLFDAIYIQYLVSESQPVVSGMKENALDRELKLDRFSAEQPVKFNKMFNNKDAKLIASIETLIAHSQLQRSTYNQNITTNEGNFVGSNISEAVTWFKHPDNKSDVDALFNVLNNL